MSVRTATVRRNPHQPAACGAKTRAGTPCRRPPVRGMTRCHKHGGTQPVGIANPNYKHGRYSKYLGGTMAADFAAVRADPNIIELRDQIALADTRVLALLREVGTGEDAALVFDLRKRWDALSEPDLSQDERRLRLSALGDVIRSADDRRAAWTEIYVALDLARKLREGERKRLVALQQLVSAEQAMTFFDALAETVRRHVTDPQVLRRIAADFAVITGRREVSTNGVEP